MSSIIFLVLRIIGISLLILLGIILVLAVLVLFFPISYTLKGCKTSEKIECSGKISWLFGFIRIIIDYPKTKEIKAKVLFFTIFNSEKKSKVRKTPGKKDKKADKREDKLSGVNTTLIESNDGSAGVTNKREGNASKPVSLEREKPEDEKKKKFTIGGLYDKIRDATDKITDYKNYIEREESRKIIDYLCFRIKKILKALKPKKFKARLTFGTGSPDTTGYIYGVYCMFAYLLGENVYVSPDFERKILEGEFFLKGKVTVFRLLKIIMSVVLDKRLKPFIKGLKDI